MKVLISDFDGSFFNEEYEKNIELVNNFVDNGNMFVIATGRNVSDLRKDMDDYFIKCSYFLCNDGATIFDQFLNIIYRKDMEPHNVRSIYNLLYNSDAVSDVYIDISTCLVSDNTRSANKIVGHFTDIEKGQMLVKQINDKYPDLYAYLSRNWININNRKSDKASAVKFLEKYYNFDQYDIYTFGDGINDISLSSYENSFILDTASDEIKQNFKHIAHSFEEVIKEIQKK